MPKDTTNPYAGCLEPWKLKLIVARLSASKIPRDQWPDIVQKLAVEISRFEFRADRAGGLSEAQILAGLINNRLRSAARSNHRQTKRLERLCRDLGLDLSTADVHPLLVIEDQTARELDIRCALAALPGAERDVCQRLMADETLTQIARAMGIGWHTVQRMIERIREQFSKMELDSWLAN